MAASTASPKQLAKRSPLSEEDSPLVVVVVSQ